MIGEGRVPPQLDTERDKAQRVEGGGRDADEEERPFDETLELYAFLLRRCTLRAFPFVRMRNVSVLLFHVLSLERTLIGTASMDSESE